MTQMNQSLTKEDTIKSLMEENKQLKEELQEANKRKEVWMKSDLQARDYAIKLERSISVVNRHVQCLIQESKDLVCDKPTCYEDCGNQNFCNYIREFQKINLENVAFTHETTKQDHSHGRLECEQCHKVIQPCKCMALGKTVEYMVCPTCKAERAYECQKRTAEINQKLRELGVFDSFKK